MSSRRVTIAEIAASAGVSVPTVSKVLNGRADVSAATRKRVQQIMADRGYQRRSSGPQRPVGLIDMAVPGLDSPWVVDVLRGALLSAIALPYCLPKMHERYFFAADLLAFIFALTMRTRRAAIVAVMVIGASLAAIVNCVSGRKLSSAPTRVMSVPCRVVTSLGGVRAPSAASTWRAM